jgi:vancomycin resistance protein YoaR
VRRPVRGRRRPWFLGALVVLALVYVGGAWALSGRVPAGVTVAGVEVGGLSRAAAAERLEREAGERASAPVPVAVGSATDRLDPVAAGLRVDLAGTADDLVGLSLDPRQLWRHVRGSSEVAPRVSADDEALAAALRDLAARVDGDPVEGAVGFEAGAPVVTPAREGRRLRADEAADLLATQWFTAPRPVRLPADLEEPDVGAAAVDEAVTSFAEPATSGPLTVVVGDHRVRLEPAEVTPALSTVAAGGRLRPVVDGAVLAAAVTAKDPQAITAPRDATVRVDGGRPVVVPAVDGSAVDPDALAEAAVAALVDPARTATVEPVVSEPELTTAEAEALGVREVVSEFSTNLTADAGRTENLRIAARTVDGTLLLPGETFSLNETLGRRTPEKGYNEAPVIMNGRLTNGVGGGVSQMATTLFNAMFFAGLEDVEHKPHSFYISRYPEGREATVNYPTVDLKFRNDSPHGVLVQTWVGGGQVHARFWSTPVWDDVRALRSARRNVTQPDVVHDPAPDCVAQSPNPGFDVTVTRQLVRGGAVARSEQFRTRYIAEDRVVCG